MEAGILTACVAIGALAELLSLLLGLWVYRRRWLRIFSVLVVFGLVFGALSSIVAAQPVLVRFVAGAALGVAYEGANLLWLRLFAFQEPVASLIPNRLLLTLTAGVPWGAIPAIAPALVRLASA